MDMRTPLIQPTQLPRSHAAFAAGAGIAAVSLAGVGLVASVWQSDSYLPFYAAEAACGAGLCVSLYKLQTVRDRRLRMAQAQSTPQPHFNLLASQQMINQIAASMSGLGAVFGTAAVGLAAGGAALKLPTQNNVAAAGVGLVNFGAAAAHLYNQVHTVPRGPAHAPSNFAPLDEPAASLV